MLCISLKVSLITNKYVVGTQVWIMHAEHIIVTSGYQTSFLFIVHDVCRYTCSLSLKFHFLPFKINIFVVSFTCLLHYICNPEHNVSCLIESGKDIFLSPMLVVRSFLFYIPLENYLTLIDMPLMFIIHSVIPPQY